MGRYIDDILQPGEKVLYSTNAHWMFFLPAIAAWIVAVGLPGAVADWLPPRRLMLVCLALAGDRGARRAVQDGDGLVPSLDHRDRRHQFSRRPQDRLHQAADLRDELDKVESVDVNQSILGRLLNYGDVTVRGSARAARPSIPSLRRWRFAMPSPRDRAGTSTMAMQQNSSRRRRYRQHGRPRPKSRSSQNCRTSGGTPRARWPRCTRSIRCGSSYIRDAACRKFDRNAKSLSCLSGLRILDIGCGAGLLCEPFTRLGAQVIGIDPSATNIAAARLHADKGHLSIDYRCTTVEEMDVRERFDIVLAMEVIEHVTDVGAFLARCAAMVKPGGIMVVSTLNRNWKSFALAIVGAEYVLRWLPRGTHQWDKFVTPDELAQHLGQQQAHHHRAGRRGL